MDAAKECGFAVSLTFIIAALISLTTLLTFNSDELWEFRHKIFRINGTIDSDEDVMSPNLTSCHQSYGRDDLLVYCCPPENPQNLKFIDFKFPEPSKPLRVRKPAHLLDEDYISKYSRAVSIMKSLPYSDPRSFSRQANLHCIFCTGAYDQKYSNISLNIHRAWFFFPWHRMFLHFHERILGSLIGDDTFALPFWNWDSPEGMTIPEMYMNEPLNHKERDGSHFPPKVADIDFVDKESGLGPQEQIEKNLAMMYNQLVSGAKKTELFMGCSYYPGEGGTCDGPGTVELAPHNTLHTWVGSSFNPQREDMGAFYSAARDPLFYAHHSNIDRMWEVWREIHGKNLPISDPAWLGSYFYFYDENLQLVRIKVSDVLDLSKLRYAYEEVNLPWLNKRPKPSVSPKLARQVLNLRDTGGSRFLYAEFGGNARNLEASMTVKVYRPEYQRTKKEKEEEEEVLVVYGIDVESNMYVKFDVYVNIADEMKINPGFREFAGTFVRLPQARSTDIESRKSTLKLGISELIEDLEADGDDSIWVTLLPQTTSCMNTTIDGIRIEYMK
ncbi:hypothetical protein FEM48_Zijuj09G0103100 [Ziziphus jujuba var. spinosa]|uniref:Tyrosinase copper-binding domain-containing protein n=1 Tax=Ziziphus jujuba var. spinosa TaxID=714518 RepID=A0A978USF4_ZIZJJ|nr:hypothetical protein FEM48_Zijuj09G0103100 [Ziziphus jujuba var. spinosa]